MKGKEIIKQLQDRWPEQYALEWDNVGLLVGNKEKDIQHIFVALDVTDDTLQQAVDCGADMIITHHPLLFSAVKKIVAEDMIGRRILKLAAEDICYYAMHTNFDVMGMADLNARDLKLLDPQVLEITYDDGQKQEGIGRVGVLEETMSLQEFGVYVKHALGLEQVLVYGEPDKQINKVAVSSGSGKGMQKAALQVQADVLVTGDIDYHTGIDAAAQDLAIVDAGHYGTEMVFIPYMATELKKMFPKLKVTAAKRKQPFQVC